ncbi:MAG: cyclase family protein [Anaerolineae bacterium]|nr:cyclase family protein [Anaerolineae bacterium]NUQ07285.1 cyclase family protein [Anaerolineae bacterium]
MCSPKVAEVVRERIANEGRPNLSRRGFLRMGGAAAAGIAVASLAIPQQKAMAYGNLEEVVDLSHVFGTTIPTYTPGEAPTRADHVTVEANGFYIQKWELYEHAGTHVDIPAHFIAGGDTVDNYPAAKLLARAVVIDISAKAAEDPDAMVTVQDLEAWESANGEIPECAAVFMYSGWESRWADVDAFRNPDADGVMHFPGFGGEAANWLIAERNIFGIGVDTLSLDIGASTTFDVHYAILGAGKFGIENVANLTALMGKADAKVVVGVPRWEEGSGGPCRLLALV